MTRVRSFAPAVAAEPRTLVLGSMPGKASLRARQYYAHPRNVFWKIMGELVGAGPELPYDQRLAVLGARGIALWDVLETCVRESSLDADIETSSVVANDFVGLLSEHPTIERVFFNGGQAARMYQKHVQHRVAPRYPHIVYTRLPSTSPANASIRYADKIAAWRAVA